MESQDSNHKHYYHCSGCDLTFEYDPADWWKSIAQHRKCKRCGRQVPKKITLSEYERWKEIGAVSSEDYSNLSRRIYQLEKEIKRMKQDLENRLC